MCALAPGFLCTFARCAAFALTRAGVFASLWSQRLRWWRPGLSPGWYASVRPAAYFFLSKTRKLNRGGSYPPIIQLGHGSCQCLKIYCIPGRPGHPLLPPADSTAEPATLPCPAPPIPTDSEVWVARVPWRAAPHRALQPKISSRKLSPRFLVLALGEAPWPIYLWA